MTLNSFVIRAVAVGTMISGGALFAIEFGILGGRAEAQAEFIPDTRPPGEFIPNTRPPGELFLTGGTGRPAPDLDVAATQPPALGIPVETPEPENTREVAGGRVAPLNATPDVEMTPEAFDVAGAEPMGPEPDQIVSPAPITALDVAAAAPGNSAAPADAAIPAVVATPDVAAAQSPNQTVVPTFDFAEPAPAAPTLPASTPAEPEPALAEGPQAPDAALAAPQLASGAVVPDLTVTLPAAPTPIAATPQPNALVIPASLEGAPEAPATPAAPNANGELSEFGMPCGITVTATAMPAAMVALDVLAPCRPSSTVTITHSGLSLDAELDELGLMTLDIPAFETPAFFSVTFEDGVEEPVLVGLPDLGNYDRIGLAWAGNLDLELHAMEFGASFGEDGHIWHENPANHEAASAGSGGFLTTIETAGTYAQIYTLPREAMQDGDGVALSIDAPVTEDNCTTGVIARTLRTEGGGPVEVNELTFTMPNCSAVGDYLVLQNLLDDLRLAANN